MTLLRYSLFPAALALGLFIAMPAFASASTLYVDLNVQNSSNNDNYDAGDFTVDVWGDNASPDSFKGTSSGSGKKMTLDEGYYAASIKNTRGYFASYSSGCSGNIGNHETEYCTITLSGYGNNYNNNNYPPYNGSCQGSCGGNTYFNNPMPCQGSCNAPATYYAQPTITKGYIPYLPNTGFEPVDSVAIALAVVMPLVAGLFLYPYVRKAFTVVLR